MSVLKVIFFLLLIVIMPVLSFFLIRLALKGAKAVDRLAKTLDDARPQLNLLLQNMEKSLTDAEAEISNLTQITVQAQEVLERVEGSVNSFQKTLGSPMVRYVGMMAAFLVTSRIFRARPAGRRRRGGRG